MRLATLVVEGVMRLAVIEGDEAFIPSLASSILPQCAAIDQSVLGTIRGGPASLEALRRAFESAADFKTQLKESGAILSVASANFVAPLPEPGMVLAAGANYHEHLKEMNAPAPATPMGFYKSVASIIGHGGTILRPPSNPDMLDWEGEFSIVIGKPCHNVSEAEALDYVFGYTIVNDVSARDWVAPAFAAQGMIPTVVAWEHNILGKLFPTFCPMGPVIATRDEISDPANVKLETRLNGMVVQSANTSDLVFGTRQLISYYSRFLTFRPGDVITTGSPSGVGYGRNPKLFMKPGDVIEVEVEGIGTLRNTVR
jgi:2-keto-4-pentenoate hydratase/2-oxohepta-3-ene-1,7-dioic acid hydratase in catechol pathway